MPAAAVIQGGLALFIIIGRKENVDDYNNLFLKRLEFEHFRK